MKLKPNDREQQALMMELVKYLKPRVYVELGVSRGATFNLLAPLVNEAYGTDKVLQLPADQYGKARHFTYVLNADTVVFAEWWAKQEKNTIDLLLIDANHEKDEVLADLDRMLPFVREGTGIIILHDTHPSMPDLAVPEFCGTAYAAAWEIRMDPKYEGLEIVTLPSPEPVSVGFSIIRRSAGQLAWNKEMGLTFREKLEKELKRKVSEELKKEPKARISPKRMKKARIED